MRQLLEYPGSQDGAYWPYRWRGQATPMHRHAELELNLVTRGRSRYLLGDRRYDFGPNFLVWLFPGQEHVLIDQSADLEMHILVFRPRLLRAAFAGDARVPLMKKNPAGQYSRRLAASDAADLGRLFASLGGVTDAVHFNFGLGYALKSAWAAYTRAPQDMITGDVHPSVERAAKLLAEPGEELDLEEVAEQVGLSATHLSRLFKAQMGVPLSTFRNRQRLERFLGLYGKGRSVTMLRAALEAGFGSYPQFHRIFKRMTGRSPQAYQRDVGPG